MGVQESGLTLEGLAQRLETLERENAELRNEVVALKGSDTRMHEPAQTSSLVARRDGEAASGFEGRLSRRSLLSKAGVAAAGLVVAGALTQTDIREAKAAQIIGDSNERFRGGVEGTNTASQGYGVMGRATDGWGVDGQADRAGVRGHTTKGIGVEGSGPTGVRGFGTVRAPEGAQGTIGVEGIGATGVWGHTTSMNFSGVYGTHNGTAGNGVTGDGTGSTGAGVLGRNPQGPGVEGRESVYGGKFSGSRAQLRLVPAGSAGRPGGAHAKGEVYMDSAGALFICVASSTSTAAAKWRKVSTTAV